MGEVFARILKNLREERGLSQQGLADALNVKRSTIGNYEQGTRSPDMETLELIADFFNVDMDYLYGKTGIRNKYRHLEDRIMTTKTASYIPETIAAHFEGKEFSEEDLSDIARFIDFVASKNKDKS